MTPAAPRHISVLGREAVEMLAPRDGGVYVDATFGAGGYSRAILDTAGTRVIGIDRDRSAITGGFDLVDRAGGRLTLVEDRFSNLDDVCAALREPISARCHVTSRSWSHWAAASAGRGPCFGSYPRRNRVRR